MTDSLIYLENFEVNLELFLFEQFLVRSPKHEDCPICCHVPGILGKEWNRGILSASASLPSDRGFLQCPPSPI